MVDTAHLIGSMRHFGIGPPYEVIGPALEDDANIPCLRVRLLESGEELDYPVEHIIADPLAD